MDGRVILSRLLSCAVDTLVGEAPLFPAPARVGPWTRYHARDLLERAEKAARAAALKRDDADAAASLAPFDGSDFHAYRRAWATARKHLPLKDVAEGGGWRSTDTLLRCYTQVDEVTMFEVVSETRKVRAAGNNWSTNCISPNRLLQSRHLQLAVIP
jgi:hypothetical protein